MTGESTARKMALLGAGMGLLWGSILRLWMRYISSTPEFSIGGTGFILGASLIAGATLGWARHRRQQGRRGWRFSIISLLLLGAGGAVMWPSVILGGAAIGQRKRLAVSITLIAGAVAAQVPIVSQIRRDAWRLDSTEAVLAIVWYAIMLALQAWAFSVVFQPKSELSIEADEPLQPLPRHGVMQGG